MRLSGPRAFRRVFRDGRRSTDRWLTVLASPNEGRAPRLGFALSRKHVRTAVMRNRVKRLVRESFRLNQHILAGLDIVVLARVPLAPASRADLRAGMDAHWARLARPGEECHRSRGRVPPAIG